MKTALLWYAALPLCAQLPYKDIRLEQQADRLAFSNSKLRLELGRKSGEWLSFRSTSVPGELIQPGEPPVALDFRIDDVWMVEKHGAAFLRHTVSVDERGGAATLCAVLAVGPVLRPPLIPSRWRTRAPAEQAKPPGAAAEFELQSCYTLFAGEGRLERSARLTRLGGADIVASTYVRMQGFLFQLPGAAPGDPADCTVENPGPLYPGGYLPPGLPYAGVKDRYLSLSSAPDSTLGFFGIHNRRLNATLATWMDTAGETNWLSFLSGDGQRITLLHYDLRIDNLARRFSAASGVHRVEVVSGPVSAALARYREMATRTMPLFAATPEWTRGMVLLEVLPTYFPDGIRGLTKKLPFYKEVGFNTIYLMPHWVGGYSPIDLYRVDPSIGTESDLKEMVRTAHSLGLRVLFDMVIHGFNRQSPMVKSNPEFFQRDEYGRMVPHQTWGSMSTDAAAPAYQRYMIDLALHDIRTYGIDGYRVDANAYKLPNWDPRLSYRAGESGPATRPLMIRMYEEMRKVKPDSVLLSEIFGPVWHSVCNLVHDNMTQGSEVYLEMMGRGEANAEHYKGHLARIVEGLPAGASRVRFARNHDTSWFYRFGGYTPRHLALDAIHALTGIPEVFAGDRKNPPHPDDEPRVWDFYRKLFAARARHPELISGEVVFQDISSDNPWVFSVVRRGGGKTTAVVVSLSDKQEKVTLRPAPASLEDLFTGERLGPGPFTLRPFQVLVGQALPPASLAH